MEPDELTDEQRSLVFDWMEDIGATEVRVEYSGENDEGFTEFDGVYYGDKKLEHEPTQELREVLELPAYMEYGGFDGPGLRAGVVRWIAEERKVLVDGVEDRPQDVVYEY